MESQELKDRIVRAIKDSFKAKEAILNDKDTLSIVLVVSEEGFQKDKKLYCRNGALRWLKNQRSFSIEMG